jgi:hypothetical protein
MKHIAFAKLGKSVKFVTAFSPIGGDNEAPAMLRILANNNPNITFHIVGRSDFCRLKEEERIELFPYDNVKDAFDGHKGPADENRIINYFDELGFQPDAFVMMMGQVGNVSIPNRIWGQRDPSKTVAIIDMTKNYTTPITKWLNENKGMHVVEVCNDPRYTLAQSKDCFVDPKISLSQYTYDYKRTSARDYDDQTRTETMVPAKYAEMEKIFLYGREMPEVGAVNRDTQFMVVLNEGTPSRYKLLKEWVLDEVEDCEIYGKWEHEDTEKDPRFKGSMPLEDLQEKLKGVRSTFIIPIKKGWVTSKYIEMIHAGVIPFFHPTYDEQDNLGVPKWLRPKNAAELKAAVAALENDKIYITAITELQDLFCRKEYYDGSKLNANVMEQLIDGYEPPCLDDYKKQTVEKFDLTNFF